MEVHDRLPHYDDILAIHTLHLAELCHDLLVVQHTFLLEAWQDLGRHKVCEHLIDHY